MGMFVGLRCFNVVADYCGMRVNAFYVVTRINALCTILHRFLNICWMVSRVALMASMIVGLFD